MALLRLAGNWQPPERLVSYFLSLPAKKKKMTLSRRTLVVENVSGATPTRDVEDEFDYYGPVKDIERLKKERICLVHMK